MIKFKSLLLIALVALASCEKDNYDAPDAGLSGKFTDATTGELVEQDIINGTQIEVIEHGYEPFERQYLIVKVDGTYENSLMFANTYTVQPLRGNFINIDPQDVEIRKGTVLDFSVTPFIRVKNATITKNGTKVVATFKLEQTVINNVRKIGLYAHSDSRVGEPMRLHAVEQNLNAPSDPNQTYTIEMDLPSVSSTLKPGNDYYFRIGALIDIGGAKPNYVKAVKIGI